MFALLLTLTKLQSSKTEAIFLRFYLGHVAAASIVAVGAFDTGLDHVAVTSAPTPVVSSCRWCTQKIVRKVHDESPQSKNRPYTGNVHASTCYDV